MAATTKVASTIDNKQFKEHEKNINSNKHGSKTPNLIRRHRTWWEQQKIYAHRHLQEEWWIC
jgi:hypothetical protein